MKNLIIMMMLFLAGCNGLNNGRDILFPSEEKATELKCTSFNKGFRERLDPADPPSEYCYNVGRMCFDNPNGDGYVRDSHGQRYNKEPDCYYLVTKCFEIQKACS